MPLNIFKRDKLRTHDTVALTPLGKEAAEGIPLAKYKCALCGYVYDPAVGDPDGGIEPNTPFESLPDDWVCPVCGAGKDQFEEV